MVVNGVLATASEMGLFPVGYYGKCLTDPISDKVISITP